MRTALKKISPLLSDKTVLGLDFDNTLISYDNLIHALAVERGFIPPTFPRQKRTIREHIRQAYGEEEWQKLQAVIYGERMNEAELSKGAGKFMEQCRQQQISMYIVSHKTEYSNLLRGGTNFRTAALKWMEQQQFFTRFGLSAERIYFASTREEKVQKIKELGCTHFIDDLGEVFSEKNFPTGVIKILYAPGEENSGKRNQRERKQEAGKAIANMIRMKHWREIHDYFFH